MAKVHSHTKESDYVLEYHARQLLEEWNWPDVYRQFPYTHYCGKKKRAVTLFLTGVGEWEMSSGVQCRELAFRCSHCKVTFSFRQVRRSAHEGWSVVTHLKDGLYSGEQS